MINQQFIHKFLLVALLVPAASVAMQQQNHTSNDDEVGLEAEQDSLSHVRDNTQKKPTFSQICAKESLRIATYAIPLSVAGYYTLPRLIPTVTNYVKENASYLGKNAALMAWNSFIFYNLNQKAKERMQEDPHPDKRYNTAWLCLAPLTNAVAMTAASFDSTLATTTAWSIFAISAVIASNQERKDSDDRTLLKVFKQRQDALETGTEILKTQMESIDQCDKAAYTRTLLLRQGTLIASASAFKENFNQLLKKGWLSREEHNDANNTLDKYNRVMRYKNSPLNDGAVSSSLFDDNSNKKENTIEY